RLADVSSRLEKTKKRAENVFAAKVELTRENEKLKIEQAELKRSAIQSDSVNRKLQLKLAEVSTQLEEARRRAVSHPLVSGRMTVWQSQFIILLSVVFCAES
ncbi:hypothetical protein PENTCL1PPCAC_5647, partial [Pristionchus entomophagus]